MKKLLVGALVGAVLVLAMLWVCVGSVRSADLPCGFQRLADICMQYEADVGGLRGHVYTWMEDGEEVIVIIGYKEGAYVGFIIGGKDDVKYPHIAIMYDIPSGSFHRIFLMTGKEELIPKKFACSVMVDFWNTFDTNVKEI